ncbi:DUF6069 family protein [Actinomadura sp. 6N118]|uniref:DUF6069 family protein n=1 Tax=Actinomadura sp. 6N118 TaxID=3375151 RepID=UPI0037A26757
MNPTTNDTTTGTASVTGLPDGAALGTRRRIVLRRALVVAGATAAALALWTLAGPLRGSDLAVRSGGIDRTVGPGAVAAAALLAGLASWALLALLERLVRRPGRAWTITATVFLALSLAGPLSSTADATTKIALAGLHLVVGATLIPGLGRSARRR